MFIDLWGKKTTIGVLSKSLDIPNTYLLRLEVLNVFKNEEQKSGWNNNKKRDKSRKTYNLKHFKINLTFSFSRI